MKRGLDTNVLIYAHVATFPEHEAVRSFLAGQLARKGVTVALTPGVLHELVHVLTDARRFAPPVSMVEALAIARLYLDHSNVECLPVDAETSREALAMVERYRLGRRRLADTLFAATLLRHGIRQIITCNGEDFEIVPGLQVIDPRRPEV
jgi:predicted nucleic acid-binding protein